MKKMKNLLLFGTILISSLAISQVRVDGLTGYTTIGGVTAATEVLEVNGNAKFGTQGFLKLTQQSGQSVFDHAGSQPFYFRTTGTLPASIVFSTDATNRLIISKTGVLRLFGSDAKKSGTATWEVVSDRNLKTNINNYNTGLDAIMQINPVTFNYNNRAAGDPSRNYVGIIAQDIEKIAPYMVSESELMNPKNVEESIGNYKSVNPNAFTYMLINAVQEQQSKIEAMESKMAQMERLLGKTGSDTKINNVAVELVGNNNQALLGQNSPNPFNNDTKIEYFVPSNTNTAKVVFTDISGNQIKEISIEAGRGNLDVNVKGLATGVYSYTLIIDGVAKATKKMIIE